MVHYLTVPTQLAKHARTLRSPLGWALGVRVLGVRVLGVGVLGVGVLSAGITGCDDERFALKTPPERTAAPRPSASVVRVQPRVKSTLGQACRFDVDCGAKLTCFRRGCVYAGPCAAHESVFEDNEDWGENIRYEYFADGRRKLSEARRFINGEDQVTRRIKTRWSGLDVTVVATDNEKERTVTTTTAFDRNGVPQLVTTHLLGKPGGEVLVYEWKEGDTCESPKRMQRKNLADGVQYGHVEIECDAAGRETKRTIFDGVGSEARPSVEQTWTVVAKEGGRDKKLLWRSERVPTGKDAGPPSVSLLELDLDEDGNVVAQRDDRDGDGHPERIRVMDYSCLTMVSGRVEGEVPLALTGTEPNAFVEGLAGQWTSSSLKVRIDVKNKQMDIEGEAEQDLAFRIVAQSPSTADLLLSGSRLIHLKAAGNRAVDFGMSGGDPPSWASVKLTRAPQP